MKMGSQELLVLKNEVHGTESHQPLSAGVQEPERELSCLRECDNSMSFASKCGDVLLLTNTDLYNDFFPGLLLIVCMCF